LAGGSEIASPRAETVPTNRIESARTRGERPTRAERVAVSTRTYIVLAALTGLVILVAFAFQVVLVNR
jgi:hypothetical protein